MTLSDGNVKDIIQNKSRLLRYCQRRPAKECVVSDGCTFNNAAAAQRCGLMCFACMSVCV